MKILALRGHSLPRQPSAEEESADKSERTGIFTSGIVSTRAGQKIALGSRVAYDDLQPGQKPSTAAIISDHSEMTVKRAFHKANLVTFLARLGRCELPGPTAFR
jgi:hypothetical protein